VWAFTPTGDNGSRLTAGGMDYDSKPVSLLGVVDWTTIGGFAMPDDAADGLVMVAANITDDPALLVTSPDETTILPFYRFVGADLRFVAFRGGQPTVVKRDLIAGGASSSTLLLVPGDRWSQLMVQARFVLDGAVGVQMAAMLAALTNPAFQVDVSIGARIKRTGGG
jgi:hypothetical protein